jgi:hypothetical protein
MKSSESNPFAELKSKNSMMGKRIKTLFPS